MNRETLLRQIQVADFALTEANLFLDTHPEDESAKEYFLRYKEIYDGLVKQYNESYGPLAARQYTGGDWTWIEGPYPWQAQG